MNHDKQVKVVMQRFEKENTGKISNKTGKEIQKLTTQYENLDLTSIIFFIDELLVEIIHHRNQLKQFQTTIPVINDSFPNSLYIDIDFSENLAIPVKWGPQSMHWNHDQVTALRYHKL